MGGLGFSKRYIFWRGVGGGGAGGRTSVRILLVRLIACLEASCCELLFHPDFIRPSCLIVSGIE